MLYSLGEVERTYQGKGSHFNCLLGGNFVNIWVPLFNFNIIPRDALDTTGLPALASSIVLALVLANLGASISVRQLMHEWRTVLISLLAMAGLLIVGFTLGSWIVGREYSLVSLGPIAGGLAAFLVMLQGVTELGRGDLAIFLSGVMTLQLFVGTPIAAWCLRRECLRLLKQGRIEAEVPMSDTKKFSIRFLPPAPEKLNTPTFKLFKLALAGSIGLGISNLTGGVVNSAICYLIIGLIMAEIGFLEPYSLQSSQSMGFLMLCLLSMIPSGISSASLMDLVNAIVPTVVMLGLGILFMGIFAIVAGKIASYSPYISVAIAMTSLFGYPASQVVTNDVVDRLTEVSDEEREILRNRLTPKMVVGGFVTVSISSVIIAGVVANILF